MDEKESSTIFVPEYTIETHMHCGSNSRGLSCLQVLEIFNMAGHSAHSQLNAQDHVPYVYRALRGDELIGNSVCLKAKGEVQEATPSLETITMAVKDGWGPSPFIHTTMSPTAALWFARSSKAMRSSGKIAKFDLSNFEGRVYDLSQGQFLTRGSLAFNFARCFSEVLLQGPPDDESDDESDRLWNGRLTEDQIHVVQVWDVSRLQVPRAKTFREFEAQLGQFPRVNDLLHEMDEMEELMPMPYTDGAGFGVPFPAPLMPHLRV